MVPQTSNRTARQTGETPKVEDRKDAEKTQSEQKPDQAQVKDAPGSHTQHTEYVEGAEHVIGTDPRRVPVEAGHCMYDGHRIVNGKHVDPMGVELDINHKAGEGKSVVPLV